MLLRLKPHPDSPRHRIESIEVDVARPSRASIRLRFLILGDIATLKLPVPGKAIRTDGLWRHSCFELFVLADSPAYHEFNLAPSAAWAMYSFTGRRTGMTAPAEISSPEIAMERSADRYELRCALDLDPLSGPRRDLSWRIGLSAVIESAEGDLSYWALAHPPGKADFHHPDCFAAELPPPTRP